MSIISGVGRAAEYGVLVRDADALQRASELDTLVFDKTGTLTEGKPQVVAVKTFAGVDEHTALRLAAALEQGSSHPLARAILDKAADGPLPEVSGFRTLRGLGVSGEAEGHRLLLGNRALLNEQHINTAEVESEMTARGLTRRHAGAAGGGWSGHRAVRHPRPAARRQRRRPGAFASAGLPAGDAYRG